MSEQITPTTTRATVRKRLTVVGAIAAALLIGVGTAGCSAAGVDEPVATPPAVEQPAEDVEQPAADEEPESDLTVSQQQAVRKAEEYLSVTAFSRDGLIKQLEFESFSTDDATFAVDSLEVDWNEQAALKAQEYLDVTAFSRDGLIEQLVFEGFTAEQAAHGATAVGL